MSVIFRGCSQGHCDGATAAKRSGHDGPDWTYVKCFQRLVLPFAPRSVTTTQPPSCTFLRLLFACTTDSFAQRPRSRRRAMPLQVERAIGRGLSEQIVFTPPKRPLPGCTLTPLNLVHILLPVLYGSASST